MKVSLNDITHMISDRVGQPFNGALQDELKVIINYKRADYFQQIIKAHPEQRKFYLKDFTAELEKVSKSECPVSVECKVVRTTLDIPTPVRASDTMFDYVGDVDKTDSYRYISPEQVRILSLSRYTGRRPSYFYSNKRIYVFNNNDLEYINVRGVFSDPRELLPFRCGNQPCYTDDDPYEIPEDIVNIIISEILSHELKNLLPEFGEVEPTKGSE